MIVPCRVEIFKKIDKDNKFTSYEKSPIVIHRLIESVKIDRRLSANTGTATINIFYPGPNDEFILYQYGGWGDKVPIVDNFNLIKIYIDNKIQFYGIIVDYSIDDENGHITVECQDMFYKLNRLVDCRVPFLEYKNILVNDLMKDLSAKAGISGFAVTATRGDNYLVKGIKIQYDTQISDVFTDAVNTSNTRCRCLKNGVLAVEDMYHTYEYSDVPNNTNYDYLYTYKKRVNSSTARRGGQTLFNRLLIRFDDKTYNAYNNPVLFNYMCCENRFKEIQTTLGDTPEKRFRVANRTFRNDTRENTTLTLDAVDGNPELDLGQALRVNLNERIGHYMVTGISTDYSPEGYFDTIDIEGLLPTNYISCEVSDGNYTIPDEEEDKKKHHNKGKNTPVKANEKKESIKINQSKACKMARIDVPAGCSSLDVTCAFDNANAGMTIVDPSGVAWGLEGNSKSTGPDLILTTKHDGKAISIGSTGTFKALNFTGYPAQSQTMKITTPMQGTWTVRGVGVPSQPVDCTMSCNLGWTYIGDSVPVLTYS